jgi:hypothetical protein
MRRAESTTEVVETHFESAKQFIPPYSARVCNSAAGRVRIIFEPAAGQGRQAVTTSWHEGKSSRAAARRLAANHPNHLG